MKKLAKTLIGIGALLMSAPMVSAQVNFPPNTTVADMCPIAKVKNNGKVLSDKGRKAILISELTGVEINKDTAFISLKKEVLARIDKDKSNYIPSKKTASKKSSATKKKKK